MAHNQPADLSHLSEAQAEALLDHVRRHGGNRRGSWSAGREALWHVISPALRAFVESLLLFGSMEITDPHGVLQRVQLRQATLTASWHRHAIGMMLVAREYFTRSQVLTKAYPISSESKDGELIARLYRDMGGAAIRGSSSRRAEAAYRGIVEELKLGATVSMTPDGPKGPAEVVKDGILMASASTGAPIFPLGVGYSRCIVFRRAWDKTELPLPGARLRMVFGAPISVPELPDKETLAELRETLRASICACVAEAQRPGDVRHGFGKPKQRA